MKGRAYFSKNLNLLSARRDLYAENLYSLHLNSLYWVSSPSPMSDGSGDILSLRGGAPK